MKTCGKCQQSKPVAEFAKAARNRDGLQHACRSCNNESGRQNYRDNSDRYKVQAQKRMDELRERIRALKNVPCADCKLRFDPVCMDFDHLPDHEKRFNVSYMLRHRMAWKKIAAEIAKCEVVCSNCHRLRTRDRLEVV